MERRDMALVCRQSARATRTHRRDAGGTPLALAHGRDASGTAPDIRERKGPRGAALLEVLVSMGLLIFGLAMVGLQINGGLEAARSADIGTRAVILLDTKLAELQAGILRPERDDEELKGHFGLAYPGYTWRVYVEQTDVDDFYMLTLEIGFNPAMVAEQVRNPDLEIDIEDPGTQIIQTAYRLFPKPADVNLERDFGITGDLMDKARDRAGEAGPGGPTGEGEDGFAGGGLNDLLSLLEEFAGGSFDPQMLADLPEEIFEQYAPFLEMLLGRRASPGLSPEAALREMLDGGRRGGRGRDRGGAIQRRGGQEAGEQQDGDQVLPPRERRRNR